MKTLGLTKIVFVVLVTLFSFVCTSMAAEDLPLGPIDTPKLIDQAKQEGTVTFYFSTPTWEGTALLEAFQKKYPFMKTDQYRSPSYKLWEKYKAEIRGGKSLADTMFSGGAPMVENIEYMTPYVTSEDKYFEYKDPQHRWIAVRPFAVSTMYNREVIPKDEIPTDWLDWINPKPSWIGKAGIGDIRSLSFSYHTIVGLYDTFGLETLKKIFAGLKKCKVQVFRASTSATEACITGEMPIVFDVLMDRWVGYGVKRKAPLNWVYPKSGMVVYNMVAGVLKDAPRPYASRLLLTHMLSVEGQQTLADMGYYVWRPGIKHPDYLRPLDKVKLIKVFDSKEAEKKREMLVKLWESYFAE